jgi:hypothetical protein
VKKRGFRTTDSGKNQGLLSAWYVLWFVRPPSTVEPVIICRWTICARNASCLLGTLVVLNLWGLIRNLYTIVIFTKVLQCLLQHLSVACTVCDSSVYSISHYQMQRFVLTAKYVLLLCHILPCSARFAVTNLAVFRLPLNDTELQDTVLTRRVEDPSGTWEDRHYSDGHC